LAAVLNAAVSVELSDLAGRGFVYTGKVEPGLSETI
jgi:hypothetical protein